MTDRIKDTIQAARHSFNDELLSRDYPHIHGNDDQVKGMIAFLDPLPWGTYLDLATGNGTVAFAMADHQPRARVIGVDIADRAISQNQATAKEQGRAGIEFLLTDGLKIGFPDATFDGITSRYALHHFPDVAATLTDARRVLKPSGTFVVADAIKHEKDDWDFINRFQALKPDGHVRIYSAASLVKLFRAHGFTAAASFGSTISFSRGLDDAYYDLIDETPPDILKLYDVRVVDDRATLTFDVLNVRFVMPAA
jgi:SAM-dependent methyltransferase